MFKVVRSKSDKNVYQTKIRCFSVLDIGWYVTKQLGKHRGIFMGIDNKQIHLTFRSWNTNLVNEGKVYDA